jgi:protein-disulfide isomerase-like protein with CxxC motif
MHDMTETVRFFFDPACPWCYQTSRWARQVEAAGEILLDWVVFSLEVQNAKKDSAEMARSHARSGLALRTALAVRDEGGAAAIGAFYAAMGRRVFERVEPLQELATVEGALLDAGLDAGVAGKVDGDHALWDRVLAEHDSLVERTRSFGVPTIVLDGGEGPAIFGPVVSRLPATEEEAVELWRHVSWLTRYANFSELKRDRVEPPDLETVRQWRAARAAKEAAEKATE